MASHTFRLQSVLDYREQLVELRQAEVAHAERVLQAQLAALAEVQARKAELIRRIADAQRAGRLDPLELRERFEYLRQLELGEQQARARAEMLAQEAEVKRRGLVQAMQDKQALEKLKERHQAQQSREGLRLESQAMDEIGVVRYYHEHGMGEGV